MTSASIRSSSQGKLKKLFGSEFSDGKLDARAALMVQIGRTGWLIPEALEGHDHDDTRVIQVFEAYRSLPGFAIDTLPKKTKTPAQQDVEPQGQLFLEMTSLEIPDSEVAFVTEFYFSLFDAAKGMFVTEEFCYTWDLGCKDPAPRVTAQCLFRDCGISDISAQLFLVCRVYHHAPLKAEDGKFKFRTVMTMKTKKMVLVKKPLSVGVLHIGSRVELLKSVGESLPILDEKIQFYTTNNEKLFAELHTLIIEEK